MQQKTRTITVKSSDEVPYDFTGVAHIQFTCERSSFRYYIMGSPIKKEYWEAITTLMQLAGVNIK